MHPKIRDYLKEMGKGISNKKFREETLLEIENHFYEKIDHLIEEGLSKEDAIERTLIEATPAKNLGKSLNIAHRPLFLRHTILLASTLFIFFSFLTLIYISHSMTSDLLSTPAPTSRDQVFLKRFRKDIAVLKENESILKYTRHKNAYPFLKKTVPILIDSKSINERSFLAIKLKNYRGWFNNIEQTKNLYAKLPFLDQELEWVEELVKYDHLNHFEGQSNISQYKEATIIDKMGAVYSVPLIDFNHLFDSVGVKALNLIKEGKRSHAKRLLDHTFALFRSNETLVGHMSAWKLIRYHNHLNDVFNLDWTPYSKEFLLALKRTPWGWTHLLQRYNLGSKGLKDFLPIMRPELGFCVGISEHPLGPLPITAFFTNSMPLEYNPVAQSSAYRKEANHVFKKCGLQAYLLLVNGKTKQSSLFDLKIWEITGADKLLFFNPMAIPYLRGIAITLFYRVGLPNYNQIYLKEDS